MIRGCRKGTGSAIGVYCLAHVRERMPLVRGPILEDTQYVEIKYFGGIFKLSGIMSIVVAGSIPGL